MSVSCVSLRFSLIVRYEGRWSIRGIGMPQVGGICAEGGVHGFSGLRPINSFSIYLVGSVSLIVFITITYTLAVEAAPIAGVSRSVELQETDNSSCSICSC